MFLSVLSSLAYRDVEMTKQVAEQEVEQEGKGKDEISNCQEIVNHLENSRIKKKRSRKLLSVQAQNNVKVKNSIQQQ